MMRMAWEVWGQFSGQGMSTGSLAPRGKREELIEIVSETYVAFVGTFGRDYGMNMN